LSDHGIALLRDLCGFTLHRVFAPCLQVGGHQLTAPSLSFLLGQHNFLAFRCEWFETPHTFTDYWRLAVSKHRTPPGIDVNSDGAIVAPCTIQFSDAKPISGIEIYSTQWDWESDGLSEHVCYDSAFRFITKDNRSFLIWCHLNGPGIATEVHFSEDSEAVAPFVTNSRLRISL